MDPKIEVVTELKIKIISSTDLHSSRIRRLPTQIQLIDAIKMTSRLVFEAHGTRCVAIVSGVGRGQCTTGGIDAPRERNILHKVIAITEECNLALGYWRIP